MRNGGLKGFGVTTRSAWRDLPGVPSFHELGFAGFEAPTWWGVLAPSAVSAPIRRRMEMELARILADPEVRSRVEAQGMDMLGTPGDEFAAFAETERGRWERVVRENRIRVEG